MLHQWLHTYHISAFIEDYTLFNSKALFFTYLTPRVSVIQSRRNEVHPHHLMFFVVWHRNVVNFNHTFKSWGVSMFKNLMFLFINKVNGIYNKKIISKIINYQYAWECKNLPKVRCFFKRLEICWIWLRKGRAGISVVSPWKS